MITLQLIVGVFFSSTFASQWLDHRQWSAATKEAFADLAQAQQDATRNSFFWTWKIGKSLNQDNPPNPMWSYSLGLANGYIRCEKKLSSYSDITTPKGLNLNVERMLYFSGQMHAPAMVNVRKW